MTQEQTPWEAMFTSYEKGAKIRMIYIRTLPGEQQGPCWNRKNRLMMKLWIDKVNKLCE